MVLTVIGLSITFTSREEGILTVYGAENLKFFTVDSNLLLGLAHLAALLLGVTGVLGKNGQLRLWTERLLYVATAAVSLTLTVVVCFFAPSLGLGPLTQGANLYFHLIEPVLAIVIFCVFHRGRHIPLWETAAAVAPSVIYGLYYTAVLLVRGVRFPDTDWYGFASGGPIGSLLTAAAVFLLTWLLALLLRLAAGGTRRRAAEPAGHDRADYL